MKKDIMNLPTLKEIEWDLFRLLQKTFSDVLTTVLKELDQKIASNRDKKRFYLHDKRGISLETMFDRNLKDTVKKSPCHRNNEHPWFKCHHRCRPIFINRGYSKL